MAQFETVPNQKIINIKSKALCDTDNLYAKVNINAMLQAMKNLTPRAFEIWLYLAKNQNNYTFSFSPLSVQKETGIPKKTVQDCIRVLIENNYLIQRNDDSNIYDFYEIPQEKEEENIIIQTHKEQETAHTSGFCF